MEGGSCSGAGQARRRAGAFLSELLGGIERAALQVELLTMGILFEMFGLLLTAY
jgi:hypothetical protein